MAEVDRDASEIAIECIAVALRCRGGGGAFAHEAMEQTIDWAVSTADSAGYDRVLLYAKTDPRNQAGAALVRRHGFGRFDAADTRYVYWQRRIEIV